MEEGKPTLRTILDQHHISDSDLYGACRVPAAEIDAFYTRHIGLEPTLRKIMETVSMLAKKTYTLEMVYTRYVYGRDNQ